MNTYSPRSSSRTDFIRNDQWPICLACSTRKRSSELYVDRPTVKSWKSRRRIHDTWKSEWDGIPLKWNYVKDMKCFFARFQKSMQNSKWNIFFCCLNWVRVRKRKQILNVLIAMVEMTSRTCFISIILWLLLGKTITVTAFTATHFRFKTLTGSMT